MRPLLVRASSCICAALVSLFLKGCEEEASGSSNNKNINSCTVNSLIQSSDTSDGFTVSVAWKKTFTYDHPLDVISVCEQCCADVRALLMSGQDYTSLCSQAGQIEESQLYKTCWSGCPSISLPPAEMRTICEPCEVGKFSATGRGLCSRCTAGRFSGQIGTTSCETCPHGRYSTSIGATDVNACLDCAPGMSSYLSGVAITGASVCENCPAGRWRTSGMGLCSACPAGTWSSAQGLMNPNGCQNCSAGRYGNASAATDANSCYECHAGTWSDSIGASDRDTCTPCDAGKWSSLIGQASSGTCNACGTGTWSSTVGASDAYACTHCEPGTWSGGVAVASNNCTSCLSGRYNENVGSSHIDACKSCVAGKFGAAPGMSECAPCERGLYSGAALATECTSCLAGYYQSAIAATACIDCPGGTYSTQVGATAEGYCLDCARGSYSPNASSECTKCEAGKYSLLAGVTACLSCPQGSQTQAGAYNCCPVDNAVNWPVSSPQSLSVPPGKYWTKIHLVDDCMTEKPQDPIAIRTDLSTVTMNSAHSRLASWTIAVATLKQSKIHTCVAAKCADAQCGVQFGVLPAHTEFIMPGKIVELGAFIRIYGNSSLQQCKQTVEVGFVGFGCEKGTIMTFLLGLVFVVSLTLLLGLAFEQCFRLRVDHFVETSLKVMPTEASSTASTPAAAPACPTLIDLQCDVQYALDQNAPPPRPSQKPVPEWQLKKLGCWKIQANQKAPVAFQVDIKTHCPPPQVDEMRKFFQHATWTVGPAWMSKDLQVEKQHPVVVREAAKLPGTDLMEAAEMVAVSCLSCGGRREVQAHARLELHATISRIILRSLMTSWAMKVIAGQAIANIAMIIILPSLAYNWMTCADGFPAYIHLIWGVYLLISSALTTWLLLRESLTIEKTRVFFSCYRVRIGLRYFAMFISISDLYQDATFPVISGRCGFDLWWVSLWLVFLGVGVMQVLVQVILLYKLYSRYHRANTPEERERIHIEAVFMALRACDNHVLVHAVKPAVEERLGGGSSWSMKLMEARVAFLRFVFEDAEQSALQASFLLFFDQATFFDKVWVGFSTGTSLLLSFTLTVQTLPEVRDWLWFQFLSAFPWADRFAEARIGWLLLLIIFYRCLSLFPWLGSCTPAGDHDDSTLRRLSFFFSQTSVPAHIKEEALLGSLYSFLVACMMIVLFLFTWSRQLRLPRRLFARLCSSPPAGQHDLPTLANAPVHDFGKRFAKKDAMSVETVDDSDTWLESLRELHAIAEAANADQEKALIFTIDNKMFLLVHFVCLVNVAHFDLMRADVDKCLQQLETSSLPVDTSAVTPSGPVKLTLDLLKVMKDEVKHSLDVARVRGRALELLRNPAFQQAGLDQKAQMIDDATEKKAPLLLLRWSLLRDAGKLPKFGEATVAEDVTTIMNRHAGKDTVVVVYFSHIWEGQNHPDSVDNDKARNLVRFAEWFHLRAQTQSLPCEVYFWIDYCCMDSGSDVGIQALPLYIASSTQILTWRTANYDRCSWPMVERLLAYTFCQGGMTPFAVNASSFEMKVKKIDGGSLGSDKADADVDSDSDDDKGKGGSIKTTKVVPVSSREEVELSNVRANYLVKKLPNPVDPVACRPTFIAAAIVQRRRAIQLVNVALAVPALEVFADRQPVDFGLTEVVEQFLGPFKRLKPGDAPSGTAEDWLKVKAGKATSMGASSPIAKADPEWHLEVRLAGGDVNPKPLSSSLGNVESTIVVVDRSGSDAPTGKVPAPDEISKLFDAVDASFVNESEDVTKHAQNLALALKTDIYDAMATNEERRLREALQRARDVELPIRAKATEMLCKLQIVNAQAAGDVQALKMALRFAAQNDLDKLPEYISGKGEVSRLKKEELKQHALSVIRQDKPDLEAIVSVLEMAQRRGWDDVVKQAVDALVTGVDGALDADGGLQRLAKVHRIASERRIHVVTSHTTKAFSTSLEKAAEAKDATVLINMVKYGSDSGIDDLVNDGTNALTRLLDHWKTSWKDGDVESKKKAREELASMLDVSGKCEVSTIHSLIDAVMVECQTLEDQERKRVAALLKGRPDNDTLIAAAETAKQWGWNKILDNAKEMWLERLAQEERRGKTAGVISLMKMYNGASERNLDELSNLTPPTILKCIDAVKSVKDAATLLEMAKTLDASGGREFAEHANKCLREVVEKLRTSDSDEALSALEQLKKAAKKSGDADIVELADGALGSAAGREKERQAKIRAQLKNARSGVEIFDALNVATSKGWAEIANEAKVKLRARVQTAMTEGVAGMVDVAKLHVAAKERSDQEIVKLTGRAFKEHVFKAKEEQDAATLLRIQNAAAAGNITDVSGEAGAAIKDITIKWKKNGCHKMPDGVKTFVDAAKDIGDNDAASLGSKLIDLASRCRDAKKTKSHLKLAEIARDAKKENFSGIEKDAQNAILELVEQFKKEQNLEGLRSLHDATKRCGISSISDVVNGFVDLGDRLVAAKAAKDTKAMLDIVCEAGDWTALAREGRSFLQERIRELEKEVAKKNVRKKLLELHDSARRAGLDDIADEAVEAVGHELPPDWSMHSAGKKDGFMLKKVAATDHALIDRIQQLVDTTFRGWGHMGPDCCTRDRIKTKNPLSSRLKVEEVVHVENTENYLCFQARRNQIAQELRALPVGTMSKDYHGNLPDDWDIKTRQVSLKGVVHHPEEPVDNSLNECWLWHGTNEEGVVGITDADFDMARAGKAMGSMFGRGLYFAESVLKADEYAKADARGWAPLLLSRVVLGRVNYCDLKHPNDHATELEDSVFKGGFHAVLGDREVVRGTFREFIVFDNDQVYPEYIVWYSRTAPMKVEYPP